MSGIFLAAAGGSGRTEVYNGTITCGLNIYGSGQTGRGLITTEVPSFGSRSPTTLTTGKGLGDLYDYRDVSAPYFASVISITGFTTDPGASYLYNVTVGGVTKLASIALYSYGAGAAYWTWEVGSALGLFGMPTSGTVSAVIRS